MLIQTKRILGSGQTNPAVVQRSGVGGGEITVKKKTEKKVSKEMAATEFLVLTMFMSSAHSFCWKPNANPFMGKNIVLIVTNFVVYLFSAHVLCKVLPIQSGLTCQLWESTGTMSSLRAPLVKRSLYPYCVVANGWTIRFQIYDTHFYQKQEELKQLDKHCIACQVVLKTRGAAKKMSQIYFLWF